MLLFKLGKKRPISFLFQRFTEREFLVPIFVAGYNQTDDYGALFSQKLSASPLANLAATDAFGVFGPPCADFAHSNGRPSA